MYQDRIDKKIYNTGIWAYPVLLVLAVIFYKERTILLDNSVFLFEILKDSSFNATHNRFISVIPQIFPVIATKMSLPLQWVMIFYSVSFVIYQFVCYLLCGRVLNNYRLGIVVLLTSVLFVTHTFFWQISELQLGMAMMMPFYALLIDNERKITGIVFWPLLISGLITIAFSHPLIIFPFMFVSAFVLLSRDIRCNRVQLIVIDIVFLIIAVLKKKMIANTYEYESIESLHNFKSLFPNYLSTYSNIQFAENWLSMYYWIPVLFIVIIAGYIAQRRWLNMLLVAGVCIGYTQLINIVYPTAETPEFYIENMYTPLGLFMAIPLVYDIIPKWNKQLVQGVFVLIIITAFVRITIKQVFYADRIAWFNNYLDKYGNEKMMVPYDNKPNEIILMPWATAYEFWLLSTLERSKSASIIISNDLKSVDWAYGNHEGFVTQWGVFKYKDLNPRYFKFTDSSHHYSVYMDR